MNYGESLRQLIERHRFAFDRTAESISLSISAGMTQWLANRDSPACMLARAEGALRQAKLTRNSVAAG
jgi:PleD family two-component response regulator